MLNVNIGLGDESPFTCDVEALPAAALQHVIYIGLRNVLMDSHASITSEEYPDPTEKGLAKLAMVEKKWAGLLAGEVRAINTHSRGDDVKRVAMQIIERHVRAKWPKGPKLDAKAIANECRKLYIAKTAVYRDLATAQLKREADDLAALKAANAEGVDQIAAELADVAKIIAAHDDEITEIAETV